MKTTTAIVQCSNLQKNVLIQSPFPRGEAACGFLGEAVPWQDLRSRLQEREDEILRVTSDIRSTSQMINKL